MSVARLDGRINVDVDDDVADLLPDLDVSVGLDDSRSWSYVGGMGT
jgi:hypothetical protein